MYNFLHKVQFYAIDDKGGGACEMIDVILRDRLGPKILAALQMKG